MKKIGKLLTGLAAAAVLAVVVLANSVVITRQNEYTVVRQFGEVVGCAAPPASVSRSRLSSPPRRCPTRVLLYDLPISDVITQDKRRWSPTALRCGRSPNPVLFIQTLNGASRTPRAGCPPSSTTA